MSNILVSFEVKHDLFCWRCCCKHTTLKCSTCVRSFHGKCARNDGLVTNDWICPVCTVLKDTENTDAKITVKLLPILIDKIWKDNLFNQLKDLLNGEEECLKRYAAAKIIKPIDLTIIKENSNSYRELKELYVDICWIVHNCDILFLGHNKKVKSARLLLNYIVKEIHSIRKCAECYSNENKHADDWFSMVCEEPHMIIWAKKDYNFWPAKLMTVNGPLIGVRYFGDHTDADVTAISCLLFSRSSPNRITTPTEMYSVAMKEANVYVENLGKRFGTFRFADRKTKFNPAFIDYYIALLMPGIVGYRLANIHGDNVEQTIESSEQSSFTVARIERKLETSSLDIEEHNGDEGRSSNGSETVRYDDNENHNETEHFNEINILQNVEIPTNKCRLFDGDIIVID